MPRPGEEAVRAETHTQQVWPTRTESGAVKPLCAYHSDVETKNNIAANHLAGDVGLEGNDVGKTQEEPQTGRCAHCDLAIQNPGKHLDMIMRPWQRGDRPAESGPTVPPHPTGNDRLDRARQRHRDNWTPGGSRAVEPTIHSLNALANLGDATDWDAHYDQLPDTVHRGYALRIPGKLYDLIHDPDSSPAHVAEQIVAKTNRRAASGTHWSADEAQARDFARKSGRTGSSDLPIVLHADRPDRGDIETRPSMLNRHQVFEHGHGEQEVPVRKGRTLNVTGISWRPHEDHPAADAEGWVHHDLSRSVPHTATTAAPERTAAMKHIAHDSGDNQRIFHCPFCGSGRVIAGSDGTTSCGFCHQNFTVQVQPMYPSFPQTVNGQPVQIPGMPGQPDMAPPGTFGPDADVEGADDGSEPPEGLSDDSDDLASPDDADDADEDSDKPPFLKNTSLYRTAAGDALDEDGYLRHLALAVADDRPAALARVRASRK